MADIEIKYRCAECGADLDFKEINDTYQRQGSVDITVAIAPCDRCLSSMEELTEERVREEMEE